MILIHLLQCTVLKSAAVEFFQLKKDIIKDISSKKFIDKEKEEKKAKELEQKIGWGTTI